MSGVWHHFEYPELEHSHCVYPAREPYQAGWDGQSEPTFGAEHKDAPTISDAELFLMPEGERARHIEQATFIVHSHLHGNRRHRHVTSQEWVSGVPGSVRADGE